MPDAENKGTDLPAADRDEASSRDGASSDKSSPIAGTNTNIPSEQDAPGDIPSEQDAPGDIPSEQDAPGDISLAQEGAIETEEPSCQVCGATFDDGRAVVCCIKCSTPHHGECWEYLGWCSTYGCGSRVCAETCGELPGSGASAPILFVDGGEAKNASFVQPEARVGPLPGLFDRLTFRFSRTLGLILDHVGKPLAPRAEMHTSCLERALHVVYLPIWVAIYLLVLVLAVPIAFVYAFLFELTSEEKDTADLIRASAPLNVGSGRSAALDAAGREAADVDDRFRLPSRHRLTVATGLLRTDGPVQLHSGNVEDVAFASPARGVALVKGASQVMVTDNGGADWQPLGIGFPDTTLSAIQFVMAGKLGFLAGSKGFLASTRDGGRNWYRVTNEDTGTTSHAILGLVGPTLPMGRSGRLEHPVHFDFLDVCFLDGQRGFGLAKVGEGQVAFISTTSGGLRWAAVSHTGRDLAILKGGPLCISFIDDQNGWLGDRTGSVFRTEDGGRRWRKESWYLPQPVAGIWVGQTGIGVAVGLGGNCWVRCKDSWRVTDNVIGDVGVRLRSIDAVDDRLVAGTSRGVVFLRWCGMEDEL